MMLAKTKEPIGCSAVQLLRHWEYWREQICRNDPAAAVAADGAAGGAGVRSNGQAEGELSNYPPSVDVRPAHQRVTTTGSDTVCKKRICESNSW